MAAVKDTEALLRWLRERRKRMGGEFEDEIIIGFIDELIDTIEYLPADTPLIHFLQEKP